MPRILLSRREIVSPENGSVVTEELRDSIVIRVLPPVDIEACHQLGAQLAEAEASDAERIVLDLDRLEGVDARLLHVILKASRRAAHNGDRLRVTRGNGHVSGIFRLTALDQTIHFND